MERGPMIFLEQKTSRMWRKCVRRGKSESWPSKAKSLVRHIRTDTSSAGCGAAIVEERSCSSQTTHKDIVNRFNYHIITIKGRTSISSHLFFQTASLSSFERLGDTVDSFVVLTTQFIPLPLDQSIFLFFLRDCIHDLGANFVHVQRLERRKWTFLEKQRSIQFSAKHSTLFSRETM